MADTKNGKKASGTAAKNNGAEANTSQTAPPGPRTRKGGMTKMEAVKRALETLGRDAMPLRIQSYVSDTFNIEMTPAHISDCKKKVLKRMSAGPQAAPGRKRGRKPGRKPATLGPRAATEPAALPLPAKGGESAGGGSMLLEDVFTAKELLDRVGAANLRLLIDGLTR